MSEKPKRILVFGMTENPGGIETLLLNVLRSIQGSEIDLDFLTNAEQVAFEDELKSYGSRVFSVTPRRKSRRKFYVDLNRFFSEHAKEYDAIWENVNSLANIDYLIYAKRYGIPRRVIHCHNSNDTEGMIRGILHRINRFRVRDVATDFWSVSNEASRWFYGYDYEKLPNYKVVTNTIIASRFSFSREDRKRIRKRLGISEDTVVVGNVGRLHPQKNQELIVRVVACLNAQGANCACLIVGKGELEESLLKLSSKLGISDKMFLTGAVNDSAPLYSAMDLFLFPSLYEGLGIALLEAEANGLPCLLSDAIPSGALVSTRMRVCGLGSDVETWANAAMDLMSEGRLEGNCILGTRFDSGNYLPLLEEVVV